MELKNELDQRIALNGLLNHPFYKAWSAGELPLAALRAYAREYGAFIRSLPAGWETVGDSQTVAEEIQHVSLWQDFATGLETQIGAAQLPGTVALLAASNRLFSSKASALGALYAFEVQQPATARSKLEGLRQHYQLPIGAESYFEVHSDNQHEAARLLGQIAALTPLEQAEALAACEQMSAALWDALTDIYQTHCSM